MQPVVDLLIVDDDANMRLTLCDILREDGYEVRLASNGEEAVELCKSTVFRLILMDWTMPGMDGLETSRRVRQHCKRSQIVMMSAHAGPDLEAMAMRAGVLAVLKKPLEIESVLTLIAHVTSLAVLLIATPPGTVRQLRSTIKEHRFRVGAAGSLDEALALTEQIHFDAILLDLDELENADEAIRSLEDYHAEMPLLIASSDVAAPLALGAMKRGAVAVLGKPLSIETVITRLENLNRSLKQGGS